MTSLQRTAIHEAGHAVVAIALGQGVELVHVRRSVACNGLVLLDPRGPDPRAEHAAAIVAAGGLAVRMAEAGWPLPNARPGAWYLDQLASAPSDRERALAAAAPTPAAGSDDQAKLAGTGVAARDAEARAGEILERHWPAVRAIADRLIQAGELEGAELSAIATARGVAPAPAERPLYAPTPAAPLTARQLAKELNVSPYVVRQMGRRLPRLAGLYHPQAIDVYRAAIGTRGVE
jgi:hypothetical protein